MNFDVNGVRYFFTFNPSEGEWVLLTLAEEGLRRIEIVNDGEPLVPVIQPGYEPGDQHTLC